MSIIAKISALKYVGLLMPVTHVSEIGAESQHQKTTAPVSDASDMQFGTEFFWYQFLVKKQDMFYVRAALWYQFLARVFGADSGRPTRRVKAYQAEQSSPLSSK